MDEPHDSMANPRKASGHAVTAPYPPPTLSSDFWFAINRRPGAVLAALIIFYLLIACAQAATKLLWCDELITLAIARQGSFAAIWRALAAGADPNPPLMHWLVLQSTRAFGLNSLAIRLPSISGVLLAIISLWSILRRWVVPGYAAVGVLAFMATRGFDYAYDARGYGLLMGSALASLALWLASVEAPVVRRIAALTGMALMLALGLSSNYYGVLALLPIAVGEAVRTAQSRRLQPGTWIALAFAITPLLLYRSLIHQNLAEFGPHAWNHPQPGMIVSSYLELVEGVFWPVLALALFSLCKRRTLSTATSYQLAALATLLLYPFAGYFLARAGHGLISPRCVVPACCGFGIAAALLCQRIFADSARAGTLILAFALFWVSARESACAYVLAVQRHAFFAVRDELARQPANQPILVGDSLIVLSLAHYSSDDVRARIVFPVDFNAIHAYEPNDSGERNLWAGRQGIYPIHIVPYTLELLASPNLLVIARPSGWLAHALTRAGATLGAPSANPAWQNLGGVFTPLAHEDTRLIPATR